MLLVDQLSRRYGDRLAVDAVSFHVAPGECVGLLGPNGAGKTSLVAMICGTARPDAGSVRWGASSAVDQPADFKRRVGLVPQDLALYDELSAWANLQLFGGLQGLGAALLRQRAEQTLSLVGLLDRRNDRVATFSGGMKRRLNLAGALLHDPELIVLDEPTVGVDPQSRNAIFDNLQSLREGGKTLLYVTHYMEEVQRLCERALVMDHGKLLADSPVAALTAQYGTLENAFLQLTGRDLRDAAERVST